MIKPEIHTAAVHEGVFRHFGVNEKSASLYGDKIEDIVKVEISVADDQTIPPAPQNDPKVKEPDYWAWRDNREQRFSLIFGKHFLLNMCFPYGMEIEEERGFGKAYRVNVKLING